MARACAPLERHALYLKVGARKKKKSTSYFLTQRAEQPSPVVRKDLLVPDGKFVNAHGFYRLYSGFLLLIMHETAMAGIFLRVICL